MANDIGWGQGAVDNGIGWGQGAINNDINWGDIYYSTDAGETDIIGSDTPIPQFTRYLIESCTFGEQYISQQYNIGDFQINDRILFTANAGLTFGRVVELTEQEDQEIAITYVGVNSPNCFDNYLTFTSAISDNDDTVFYIDFYCNPSYDFNWTDDEYEYPLYYNFNLNIYYQGINDEGDSVSDFFNINENIEIIPYNFIGGQNNNFYTYQQDTGDLITYIIIDGGSEQPSFGSTPSFLGDGDCAPNYFLRNSGYAFFANYRQDC